MDVGATQGKSCGQYAVNVSGQPSRSRTGGHQDGRSRFGRSLSRFPLTLCTGENAIPGRATGIQMMSATLKEDASLDRGEMEQETPRFVLQR